MIPIGSRATRRNHPRYSRKPLLRKILSPTRCETQPNQQLGLPWFHGDFSGRKAKYVIWSLSRVSVMPRAAYVPGRSVRPQANDGGSLDP